RLEPGPETAAGAVGEGAHLDRQLEQHQLGDVVGVGILHAPAPAPGSDARAVVVHELAPGGRTLGALLAQPAEQAQAGGGGWRLLHEKYPPGEQDLNRMPPLVMDCLAPAYLTHAHGCCPPRA